VKNGRRLTAIGIADGRLGSVPGCSAADVCRVCAATSLPSPHLDGTRRVQRNSIPPEFKLNQHQHPTLTPQRSGVRSPSAPQSTTQKNQRLVVGALPCRVCAGARHGRRTFPFGTTHAPCTFGRSPWPRRVPWTRCCLACGLCGLVGVHALFVAWDWSRAIPRPAPEPSALTWLTTMRRSTAAALVVSSNVLLRLLPRNAHRRLAATRALPTSAGRSAFHPARPTTGYRTQ
jgi:hypothetical protein